MTSRVGPVPLHHGHAGGVTTNNATSHQLASTHNSPHVINRSHFGDSNPLTHHHGRNAMDGMDTRCGKHQRIHIFSPPSHDHCHRTHTLRKQRTSSTKTTVNIPRDHRMDIIERESAGGTTRQLDRDAMPTIHRPAKEDHSSV